MYFKGLSIVALAIVLIIHATGLLASDTRLHSMANVGGLTKDYYNMFDLPSAIVSYPNLLVLGFGGTNFSYDGETPGTSTPFAGATVGLMAGHVVGVFVSGDREKLPFSPTDIDYQYNLFYGFKLKALTLGIRFNNASGRDKVSGYPESQLGPSGNYEKSVGVIGLTIGGGLELSGNGSAEAAFHYQTTSFSDKEDKQTNTEPEAYRTIGFRGRLFYGLNEKTELVPFFSYENEGQGQQVYINNEKSNAQTLQTTEFVVGIGVNLKPAENMLMIGGIGYLQSSIVSEYKPVNGAKQESESSLKGLPIIQLGFEAQLKSWLTLRTGAQKLAGAVESKQTVSDNTITTESGYSPFGFSVGIGFEHKNLSIDFMLDRDYLKRGPYILSGSTGRMFPRATATYAF